LLHDPVFSPHEEWCQIVNRRDGAESRVNNRIGHARRKQNLQALRLERHDELFIGNPCKLRAECGAINSPIAHAGWNLEVPFEVEGPLTKEHKFRILYGRKMLE